MSMNKKIFLQNVPKYEKNLTKKVKIFYNKKSKNFFTIKKVKKKFKSFL